MKTIWVTGSKGQLGTEINLQQSKLSDTRFIFTDIDEIDLTNKTAVIDYMLANKPDLVINCAAYTAVDKAESDAVVARLINTDVPAHLATLCADLNSVLIHISTDYVFDGTNHIPYTEEMATNPNSVYGNTKLVGEKAVLAYPHHLVIRTSWLYSAHGTNFVKTMLRLGSERNELNVIYDQIGTPTSAADLAAVLLHIVASIQVTGKLPGGIYHFSNEGVCSWYDFAKEIIQIAGIHCNVNPITTEQYPLPAPRPHYSVFNKSKIKRDFDIEIPYWKDSLKTCIDQLNKS